MEENAVSERIPDDVDWATAAEQSSEDDEAQEGNVLAGQEQASDAAEHVAVHVVDEDADEDDTDLDGVEIDDPEADAVVNDALEIDETAEAEAAAEVLTDSLEEEIAEQAAEAADEVEPYDGPEPELEVSEETVDYLSEFEAAAGIEISVGDDEDPYDAFRTELRMLPGKWYVIHSYAGFERKVKANIEQRKSTLEVEEDIYQVEVPMEDVVEIKNGQRKMVTRVRIPGYVLVRMELTEDT